MEIEITKITSKGQVVIPQDIRKRKNISEGEKFLVYDTDDSIILKRVKNLEKVKSTEEFEKVFRPLWITAKKQKITEKDAEKEIGLHRKEKNVKSNS